MRQREVRQEDDPCPYQGRIHTLAARAERIRCGRPVEVFIVELPPADRLDVFAEALHKPDTPEGCRPQARIRAVGRPGSKLLGHD